MNLQLASTEEYIDGNCTGNLGEVLVRYRKSYITTTSGTPLTPNVQLYKNPHLPNPYKSHLFMLVGISIVIA